MSAEIAYGRKMGQLEQGIILMTKYTPDSSERNTKHHT